MDCIVINLDRHAKRWDRIDAALDTLGISHRRFAAVDGRTVGDQYDALMTPNAKRFTPYGVLGCALSHKMALRSFLEHDAAVCLLLEDDAVAAPEARENLDTLLQQAPEGWDVVKLASKPQAVGGPLFHKNNRTINACAQLFSRAGAAKVVAQRIFWPSHADVTPWFVTGLQVYTVRSDVRTFYQTWALSSLTSKRYPDYKLNLKFLRVGGTEFTSGDLLVAVLFSAAVYFLRKKRRRFK
jgi:GR25 family glycosyltransferase involved in LPS biosynthesis